METGIYFEGPKGRIDRSRLMLVEGVDDAHFFDTLLGQANADPAQVGLLYMRGKDALSDNLSMLIKSPSFQSGKVVRIAIVLDSDTVPAAALQSVNDALTVLGWPHFEGSGFNQVTPALSLGLHLLPSMEEPGDLERVCLATIPEDERVIKSVAFQQDIDMNHGPLDKTYKRQAAIFLACVAAETRGVGRAFELGVFDSAHSSLNPLKGFITEFLG